MQFNQTQIPDVILIKNQIHKDERGFFNEFYHKDIFYDNGISDSFIQSNHSRSIKNTLRGLHYQNKHPQSKLVKCIRGEILDIAVDIRPESIYFGKWVGQKLSGTNGLQLYIPVGFAHGFLVLSDTADVIYQCNEKYYPEDNCGIIWNDPTLNIDWGIKKPILSIRDQKLPFLLDLNN